MSSLASATSSFSVSVHFRRLNCDPAAVPFIEEIMEDDEDEGPFRYRNGVRVIAVFDAVNLAEFSIDTVPLTFTSRKIGPTSVVWFIPKHSFCSVVFQNGKNY